MGHIWGSVFPAVWLNTFSHELLTFLLSFFLAVFQGRRGPRSRPAALWRQLPGLTRGEDLIKNSFLFIFFYRQRFFHCWNCFASAILCCDMEHSQQTAHFDKKKCAEQESESRRAPEACSLQKNASAHFSVSDWWWWVSSVELKTSVRREEHMMELRCDVILTLISLSRTYHI